MSADSSSSEDTQLRADIDRSLRFPLLFFFTSAAAWLVLGSLLGFISSLSLNMPGTFASISAFHYGRVYPAHMNALLYGWALQAGFGVALWIMARLCRVPARNGLLLIVAGHLWNAAVAIGLLGILCGFGTSIQWMDFPAAVWPILLIAYLLIAFGMFGMFNTRRDKTAFVSQWMILAATLWFPLIYITANVYIHHVDGGAVAKTAVNAWFTSNLIYMVLAPLGLATSYYIIAKVIGRPIANHRLAWMGFWALAIFTGWTGVNRLAGGPLPAWMSSIGSAATICLLIPAFIVGYTQLRTLKGRLDWANHSPSLRFTILGTFAFIVTVVIGALLSLNGVGRFLQFSNAQSAYELLAIYGFFSMGMLGAIYFIVPRICGCEWRKASWINFHFLFSAYGIATIAGFMFCAGLAGGSMVDDFTKPFYISSATSWSYLVARTLGWFFLLLANLMFVGHLLLMAIRKGRKGQEGPTLFHKKPEDYFNEDLSAEKGAKA